MWETLEFNFADWKIASIFRSLRLMIDNYRPSLLAALESFTP